MSTGDTPLAPVLTGIKGWVAGERFRLPMDSALVIGRSRSCDLSLRRVPGYRDRPGEERDRDHDFNTVSRRHLRLTVRGGRAFVEDLSTNGSFCDEALITGPREVDLSQSAVTLRLGTRETFRLELLPEAQAPPELSVSREPESGLREPAASAAV